VSKRLLLISSSALYGSGYLDHAAVEIRDLLGEGPRRVLFIPFALADWDAYAERAKERFALLGHALDSVHQTKDARAAVESDEALFVGGGKAFGRRRSLRERRPREFKTRAKRRSLCLRRSGTRHLGRARARSSPARR